jgi:hypothetical protein
VRGDLLSQKVPALEAVTNKPSSYETRGGTRVVGRPEFAMSRPLRVRRITDEEGRQLQRTVMAGCCAIRASFPDGVDVDDPNVVRSP